MAWKTCQVSHEESLIGKKNGFQQPHSNINGLAPSPLVRSDAKKRSHEVISVGDSPDSDDDTKRQRNDDSYVSAGRPTNVSALRADNPSTPLMAVQLFKRSPEMMHGMMCENVEVVRSPSDVAAATS